MHRAKRTRVRAGDNRGAGRGTDRKGDKGVCVSATLRGEAVKVWCHGVVIAIAGEVGADVFTTYPKYVWAGEGVWLRRYFGW